MSSSEEISSPKHTYIFMKIQLIQLFLKETPVDAVQQPGYIYICENSTSQEGGKIQATARRDPNATPPQTQQEGVGTGRE